MSNLSLYAVTAEFRQMVDALMDTQTDAQAIADTIEAESFPLVQKACNVAFAIRNLEATAEAIKNAENKMAKRRKAIETRAKNISDYLLNCMTLAGIDKIDSPYLRLAIQSNPPAVDAFEPALIPPEYLRQPPLPPLEIDKAAIKQAINDGIDVPGARLTQSKRLSIK